MSVFSCLLFGLCSYFLFSFEASTSCLALHFLHLFFSLQFLLPAHPDWFHLLNFPSSSVFMFVCSPPVLLHVVTFASKFSQFHLSILLVSLDQNRCAAAWLGSSGKILGIPGILACYVKRHFNIGWNNYFTVTSTSPLPFFPHENSQALEWFSSPSWVLLVWTPWQDTVDAWVLTSSCQFLYRTDKRTVVDRNRFSIPVPIYEWLKKEAASTLWVAIKEPSQRYCFYSLKLAKEYARIKWHQDFLSVLAIYLQYSTAKIPLFIKSAGKNPCI